MRGDSNSQNATYAEIKSKIVERIFYPGQRLSEVRLARHYGVSRTPVREALKRLEHEGLVAIRPKSGTYVEYRTERKTIELFQVRAYLECLAYRLAVTRMKTGGLRSMQKCLARMDALLQQRPFKDREFAAQHYRFHHLLVKASGNATLLSLFEQLNLPATQMFALNLNSMGNERTMEEHHRLLDMLSARDTKGEKLLEKHLWENVMYASATNGTRRNKETTKVTK